LGNTKRHKPNFYIAARDGKNIRLEILGANRNTKVDLRQDRSGKPDRDYHTGLKNGSVFPAATEYKDAFWQIEGVPAGKTITINLYYQ
jgi:hypothetical protein